MYAPAPVVFVDLSEGRRNLKHWVRASIATAVLVTGFVAKETKSSWRFAVYAVAGIIVFSQNAWEFKPDRRIDRIRRGNLDPRLATIFASARQSVKDGQRLPFRVNIMVKRWRWYRPVLQMVYSFEMRPSDDDYGLVWGWPRGLCWEVYATGRACFTSQADPASEEYKMTKRQQAATRHVKAVISLPIRSAHGKDGEPLRATVVAVLNIDAITDDAAKQLAAFWKEIESNHSHALVALADYAGLYY